MEIGEGPSRETNADISCVACDKSGADGVTLVSSVRSDAGKSDPSRGMGSCSGGHTNVTRSLSGVSPIPPAVSLNTNETSEA